MGTQRGHQEGKPKWRGGEQMILNLFATFLLMALIFLAGFGIAGIWEWICERNKGGEE